MCDNYDIIEAIHIRKNRHTKFDEQRYEERTESSLINHFFDRDLNVTRRLKNLSI